MLDVVRGRITGHPMSVHIILGEESTMVRQGFISEYGGLWLADLTK